MARCIKTLLAGLAALTSALALAAPPDDANDEQDDLLALLEEQTRIATKTKLNADYVPGMVTVLHGDELEAQGLRTVWEAMGLVPGVDPVIDNLGQRRLLFRGVGNINFSGNFKVLLNGIPMNSAHKGLADPILNIPIEQVERIEAIRGPGSAVHGEFAFVGVIDVITRTGKTEAFVGGGSYGEHRAGASLSWQDEEGDRSFDLNAAGWRHDGASPTVASDELHNDPLNLGAFSEAPGEPNDELEAGTAVARYRDGDFELLGQWSEDAFGDHYGVNFILPPPGDSLVVRHRIKNLEARHETQWSDGWQTRFRIGRTRISEEKDDQYRGPAAFFDPNEYDLSYEEQRDNIEADLIWEGTRNQTVLVGLAYTDIEILEARDNDDRYEYQAQEGQRRIIRAVTLQDEIRLGPRLTVTAGLRHDDYSDSGNSLSPRIAAVWRLRDRHILKAQYGEAFRPPTLYESSDGPDPATIQTTEIGYIHKGARREARITLFYSELNELIVFDDPVGYTNTNSARLHGVELEGSMHLTRRTRLGGNLSYLDSEDDSTDQELAGSATWHGNLFAAYQPGADTRFDLRLRFLDEYHRHPADPRGALDGYETLDLTASFDNPWDAKDWSARGGVKNVLDAAGRYPARLASSSTNDQVVSYNDDFPRPDRTWWLQLRYTY